jgi:hypothetical protein
MTMVVEEVMKRMSKTTNERIADLAMMWAAIAMISFVSYHFLSSVVQSDNAIQVVM